MKYIKYILMFKGIGQSTRHYTMRKNEPRKGGNRHKFFKKNHFIKTF